MASFDAILREQISNEIDLETMIESVEDTDIIDIINNEDGETDGT